MFKMILKNPRILVLIGCVVIGTLGTALFMSTEARAETPGDLIRLHVIANSDSAYDQEVKLIVRDSIIEQLEILLESADSKAEAQEIIGANLLFLQSAAQKNLEQYADYGVSTNLGKAEFPTKYYGELVLPAGEYDALRIVLGAGEGKNWWCVIFPPLCFVDAAGNIGSVPKVASASTGGSRTKGEIAVKWKLIELLRGNR